MRKVFVDTSGFFALIDKRDRHHALALRVWETLVEDEARLLTTNYIVLETMTLLQNRLSLQAALDFDEKMSKLLDVHFMDEVLHGTALKAFRKDGRRKLSLVDYSSFVAMRALGLEEALAFDRHFVEQGFRLPRFS